MEGNLDEQAREAVREHYAETARNACACSSAESNIYDPATIAKLPPDAVKASRGCADPHAFAHLETGERVLDLGSGGGIDSLLAAREVGPSGSIVGVDMTDEMLALACKNAAEGGFSNVEFRKGYIEDLSSANIDDGQFDCVISNCVINLSPDKPAVLREAYRALRDGGRFVVADVVALRQIEPSQAKRLSDFLGCMSGVLEQGDYSRLLEQIGFCDVSIQPTTVYSLCRLKARAERKGLQQELADMDEEQVDGAFAGAIVMAWRHQVR